MKFRTAQYALLAAAVCTFTGNAMHAQDASLQPSSPIVVHIDANQTAPPISKYEYGMFIEHIGPLIYHSVWAEMLDDRKFYFPINSQPDKKGRPSVGPPMRQLLKWRPVGPDADVVLDTDNPFVGDHSPRITLDASTPHGISQTGIWTVKDKHYVGHIWLRGTPGAKVEVTLI
ncbi:MAG: alpha-N-arabinofuranosidase, partial [Acidobacteriota bacterium]|nr:alpha-N-arabinofuranosidase [Acidobacteriota bacterium]